MTDGCPKTSQRRARSDAAHIACRVGPPAASSTCREGTCFKLYFLTLSATLEPRTVANPSPHVEWGPTACRGVAPAASSTCRVGPCFKLYFFPQREAARPYSIRNLNRPAREPISRTTSCRDRVPGSRRRGTAARFLRKAAAAPAAVRGDSIRAKKAPAGTTRPRPDAAASPRRRRGAGGAGQPVSGAPVRPPAPNTCARTAAGPPDRPGRRRGVAAGCRAGQGVRGGGGGGARGDFELNPRFVAAPGPHGGIFWAGQRRRGAVGLLEALGRGWGGGMGFLGPLLIDVISFRFNFIPAAGRAWDPAGFLGARTAYCAGRLGIFWRIFGFIWGLE